CARGISFYYYGSRAMDYW
nr:immunoglobulin heavy chain junction region [Mus musculus]